MYSDVVRYARSCSYCQSHGRKPPKQKIQGHIHSDVPGEVWVLDVLHFNKSRRGNKYVLTMVDVATRYAEVVPLPEITSVTVARAVEDRLIGGAVSPKLFISDNGSEFKKDMKRMCEIYSIQQRTLQKNFWFEPGFIPDLITPGSNHGQ